MKTALFIALGIFSVAYIAVWLAAILREHRKGSTPDWRDGAIGFITNFFDTLGIGSFAPTTSFFKLWKLVPDEQIPGTLNVGHTIPTLVEAFIYIAVVNVDLKTLILMIGASVAGAWFGAGIVAKWPRRWIQVGMGLALLVMAGIFLMTQLKLMPGGGDALGLDGVKLGLAVVANAMLGALMTLGIGMYGPCMILISLLGMNPKAAFPIMMGSCAFLMPVGSARFIREKRYNLKAALGLTIGGIPGVLIAAYIVREMSLDIVRWLVIVVVVYTSLMMTRSAALESGAMRVARTIQIISSGFGGLVTGAVVGYWLGSHAVPFDDVVRGVGLDSLILRSSAALGAAIAASWEAYRLRRRSPTRGLPKPPVLPG